MEPRTRQVDDQADMLAKVMEQALLLSRAVESAMSSLDASTKKFDANTDLAVNQMGKAAMSLPDEVSQAVVGQMGLAAQKAADVMVEKWKEANAAAERAAKTFNQAALDAQEASRRAAANAWRNFALIFAGGLLSGMFITMVLIVVMARWM